MAFTAKWRFARITARKARLLTDLIRNQPVGKAFDLLKFNKKRGAIMIAKVLRSAIANADAKEADVENLYVSKSFCDDGPIMKRFMPKDRGKSFSIFKRLCHITVEVDEGGPPVTKRKQRALDAQAARREKSKGKKKSKSAAGDAKSAAPGAESK